MSQNQGPDKPLSLPTKINYAVRHPHIITDQTRINCLASTVSNQIRLWGGNIWHMSQFVVDISKVWHDITSKRTIPQVHPGLAKKFTANYWWNMLRLAGFKSQCSQVLLQDHHTLDSKVVFYIILFILVYIYIIYNMIPMKSWKKPATWHRK